MVTTDLLNTKNQGTGSALQFLRNTTTPGSATPSFDTSQSISLGFTVGSAVVADLNGDGKPDIIALDQDHSGVVTLTDTTAAGASSFSFGSQQSSK